MNDREKIGALIKKYRMRIGITQQQLAEKVSMERTTINKLENGKFNFSVDLMSKICKELNCEISIKDKDYGKLYESS